MRVYFPSTLPAVAGALRAGQLGPPPLTGYAVTPALIEWYASGDVEELEYIAMIEAARASLRLLALTPDAPARRVVFAAEVPEDVVRAGSDLTDRATVTVTAPVPLSEIAAAHVDDTAATADVRAAIAALDAADSGDADARFIVDSAEAHELAWYATQELPQLLR